MKNVVWLLFVGAPAAAFAPRPYVAPVRCARRQLAERARAATRELSLALFSLTRARISRRSRARAQVELADGAAHVDDR